MTIRRRKTAANPLAVKQIQSTERQNPTALMAAMSREICRNTKICLRLRPRNPNKMAKTAAGKLASRALNITLPFLLPLALTACASVPLMSLPKLMALDVETLEMDKIELAIRLDDTIGIRKDSAQLFIKVENEKTNKSLQHRLILNVRETELTPFLQKKEKSGYTVHRFKLTPEQALEAQNFRQSALEWRDKGGKDLRSNLTAQVGFCQFEDGPSYEEGSMTFYVRTNPKKDFYTLFKKQNFQFSDEAKAKFEPEGPVYCD